ncbi:MAG: M23 family peptidase, partial [Acidobacteria bacterium]|nr:M23 family peptidase [Acidobacteriota bacterium]
MLLLIAAIGAGLFVFTSPEFERSKPEVSLVGNNGYWNLKTPLVFQLDDESGLKSYNVTLIDGATSYDL